MLSFLSVRLSPVFCIKAVRPNGSFCCCLVHFGARRAGASCIVSDTLVGPLYSRAPSAWNIWSCRSRDINVDLRSISAVLGTF